MSRRNASVLRIGILLLLSLFLTAGCSHKENDEESAFSPASVPADSGDNAGDVPEPEPEPIPEPEPEPDPKQTAIENILQGMTLEEKVGQMFFVRCPDVDAAGKISQYHLGGYLLFTKDFKDTAGNWLSEEDFTVGKIEAYQTAAEIPLLIGVDEEGGTVARASRNPNLFPAKCKSPQRIYASNGMAGIENDALEKNSRLLEIGINVNFAPVADVSTNPADFMYDRAFGQDAGATAEYVQTVIEAMKSIEIGSVLKHFPGYGNNVDTHTGIAIDERSYEQFLQEDFLPFRAGIEAGAGSVLVSHNIVNSMDAALPASLSAEVHRILRDELNFEGVVLTDDLAMDAVEAYAEDGSVAVLAVLAGNDMIVTTDFETQIPLVIDAVQVGMIDVEVIDNAVSRVLAWKYDLGLLQ